MKRNKWIKKILFSAIGITLASATVLGIVLPTVLSQKQITNKNNTEFFHNNFALGIPNSDQEVTIDNLTYALNAGNMQATVLGFSTNNVSESSLILPGVINVGGNYYRVTNIANGAFFNSKLTSVTLPDSINSIGADAFANNYLTNITLPPNLTNLGNNAFSNNWFGYNTTIYLPSHCNWNKYTNTAPFDCTYNLGYFCPGIQNIVQDGAVYNWNPLSGSWTIQSYQPSIAIGQKNNVVIKPGLFSYRPQPDSLTHPRSTHFNYGAVQIATNSSIDTTRILFNSPSGKIFMGELSFINNQISFTGNTSGSWIFPNNRIKMSIYSSVQGKELFNNFLTTNNCGINGITLQTGDILTFQYTNLSSINFYTNVPTTKTINRNTSLGSLDLFYCINNENAWKETQSVSFMVTPNGFIPYQKLLHLKVNVLNNVANQNIKCYGYGLANHQIRIEYNGNLIITTTDDNGKFNFDLPSNTPLNTVVNISCPGCIPTKFKLIGNDPINSGFLFRVGNNKFGICPNGYTNKFELWNNNVSEMPDYNNPNLNITSDNFSSSNWSITNTNTKLLIVNNQYANLNSSQPINTSEVFINFSQIRNANQLNNLVSQLNYNPNLINDIQISYTGNNPIAGVCSNGLMINSDPCSSLPIPINKFGLTNPNTYFYTVTNDAISNNINKWNSNLGADSRFIATNYMMVRQSDNGACQTDNYASNWYDPTPEMWQTVRSITANLQTTYQKATALCEWVSQNMTYTTSYAYHHPISGTFNHLSGVCGNFAALLAVMGQMAGLVTRSIRGLAYSTPNYFSLYWDADHEWAQVWDEQMGEWITLDPTWWWYTPYGQVQSSMNWQRSDESVTFTMWPTGTNYFSYFKGHEDQALWNLGCSYGIQVNSPQNIYPAQYAVNLTNLLNEAGSLKTGQSAYVDENASL